MATDSAGNVVTVGRIDNADPWIAKFNAAGTLLWQKKPGPAALDQANGVAIDGAGNIIVSITTGYPINTWLLKYNAGGVLRWIREYSAEHGPGIRGLAANGAGEVFATGRSDWAFSSRGAFIAKYSSVGAFLQDSLINSDDGASAQAVAVNRTGNPYVVGYTSGDLGGPNKGRDDAFLVKFPK